MTTYLTEVERFANEDEFRETQSKIRRMVSRGDLYECGLDPSEPFQFVEVYQTPDGDIWRLAIPDHAFRGYLKSGQKPLP